MHARNAQNRVSGDLPEHHAAGRAPDPARQPRSGGGVAPQHRDPVGAEAGPSRAALFEIATEVCNKVGGIYQVIRSKIPAMQERWGDRYTLVGPYTEQAAMEFEADVPTGWYARIIERLAGEGVNARYGRWLVRGSPRTILLELDWSPDRLADLKYMLWQHHGVECPGMHEHVDRAVLFGRATYQLIRAAAELAGGEGSTPDTPERVIAHFHEWLAGLAIPDLRRDGVDAATVFTTHATLLGRYLASNHELDYDKLHYSNGEHQSQRYNVPTEFRIEKACAHAAHSFTTVSPITGEECQHLLGRTPDAVLPNGLDVERFSVGPDFHAMHGECKKEIHRFTMAHFFPSYQFDLDRTLYFFTSGRYEPVNKGFDLALEAMARLNAQIRDFGLDVNVIFFIVTNRPTEGPLPGSLESRGVLNELQSVCERIVQDAGAKLFPVAAAGSGMPGELAEIWSGLLDDYWKMRYRKTQQAFKRDSLPAVVTHKVIGEDTDPVLNHIRQLGLHNRPDDPVKVVYHPEFIRPESPLWGIEYEQFVRGCHLGVFPSAYEPWGYTPLECMALGVPAITSDLAGFGAYVRERFPDHDRWGVNVLRRRGRGFHDSAAELARWLLAYCRLERHGRIDLRNAVERRAAGFGWSRLAPAYHRAHDAALERLGAEIASRG
ncbi:MAG: glycosyltransferase [Planctomycetota bacterium]